MGQIREKVIAQYDTQAERKRVFKEILCAAIDEYIASEKEDLESYKADLEEALEELKDMRADWKPEKGNL